MKETLDTDTKESAAVVSEDEDTEVFKEATTCRTVLSSKGSLFKRVAYPLLNAKLKKQKTSACMTVISSDSKNKERLCCIFPGSVLEIRKEINQIFKDELSFSSHRKQRKRFLKTSTFAQSSKTNRALKTMW